VLHHGIFLGGYEEIEVCLLPQINIRACAQVPDTPSTVCPSSRGQSDVRMEGSERTLLISQSERLKYGSTYKDGPVITAG
jgi:hypothetical protein